MAHGGASGAVAVAAFITPIALDSYEIAPPKYFLKSQDKYSLTRYFYLFLKNNQIMHIPNRTLLYRIET
jgi:hypothetical protein